MKKLLKFLLNFQLKNSQLSKGEGFTLIELLVALVIASIVLSSLLGFMVNILTTERREQAKSESEQEIQTAINYIARDLRQAVYIYDAEALSNDHTSTPTPAAPSGIRNQIPPLAGSGICNDPATCQPVLVFWKREFIENAVPITASSDCDDSDGTIDEEECDDTFVYSLIGYYLIKDTDATWSGTARIARFQLNGGVSNTATSVIDDYVPGHEPDPGFERFDQDTSAGTLRERMNQWTKTADAYDRPVPVLVDFIDHSSDPTSIPPPNFTTPVDCSDVLGTEGYDLDLDGDIADGEDYLISGQTPDYTATGFPADLATGSFYACVDPIAVEATVFIRGNAFARFNNPDTATYQASRSEFFPTTSLRVKGRGLVN